MRMMPSALAPEDLLAHIRNLSRARGPGALAAPGTRAASAARTDDACGRGQGIADPGDVQHVGDRSERGARRLRYARFTAPMRALAEDRIDQRVACRSVRGERRGQVNPH